MSDKRPDHLIAQAAAPTADGWRRPTHQRSDEQSDADLTALGPDYARLVTAALPHDGALANLSRLTDLALVTLRTGSHDSAGAATAPRRSAAIVDKYNRAKRDADRERILGEMAHSTPDDRRFLIDSARDLHDAAERKHLRRKATFEMRKAVVEHFGGMSDRAIAYHIRRDLLRRCGDVISSTRSTLRDRLADAIIVAHGGVPSERIIREEIRPRRFGQEL